VTHARNDEVVERLELFRTRGAHPRGDRQQNDRAKEREKVAKDVISFGSSCIGSVLSELGGTVGGCLGVSGGVWGVSGGCLGGVWGVSGGNYWGWGIIGKRLLQETAVCRLRSPQRASATPGRPPFLVDVPGGK
jgi:hypothetical protein